MSIEIDGPTPQSAVPYQEFTVDESATIMVPQGTNMVCALDLLTSSGFIVKIIHTAPVQDFSLQCWFSKEPGGTSISYELEKQTWHPIRKLLSAHALVADDVLTPTLDVLLYTVKSTPGLHYLNVMNLANTPNGFYVEITPLTSPV